MKPLEPMRKKLIGALGSDAQHGPRARRRSRRSCSRRRDVPHRRASAEDRGRRHQRSASPSIRSPRRRSASRRASRRSSSAAKADGRSGNCDSGYSCAYSQQHLLALGHHAESARDQSARRLRAPVRQRRSVGDSGLRGRKPRTLQQEHPRFRPRRHRSSLKQSLGSTDRRKLDEYLTAVREIETRIANAEKLSQKRRTCRNSRPASKSPTGVPVDFAEHARLMFDLMALALQTDLTRIMTFMMAREGSNRHLSRDRRLRRPPRPDASPGQTPIGSKRSRQINRYHVEQFAYFLQKLDSIQDGDGTLLDHSMIVYGSSISRRQSPHAPRSAHRRRRRRQSPDPHRRTPSDLSQGNATHQSLPHAARDDERPGAILG